MNWHKVWLVLRREYVTNFRRPSFLFTAFGVPLLSLGVMGLIIVLVSDRENNLDAFQRVGYVDRAQVLDPAGPHPDGYLPVSDPALVPPAQGTDGAALSAYYDALEAAAARQLLDGALDAYIVLDSAYLFTGQVQLYTRQRVPQALLEQVEAFLVAQMQQKAPADLPVPPERLRGTQVTLRDLDSGRAMSDAAVAGRLFLPFIFVMLYVMSTNTTAQFLMSGVVEEKENRLMEILATSVRPLDLLWGKLLGLGALALTQIALWLAAGVIIARINADARAFLTGASFAPQDIALLVVLFFINFLLFSAAMLSIGASVTAEAESRQIAAVFAVVAVLPIMFLVTFFKDPNGPLPVAFTFIPLTGAMALILRLGLGEFPAWQLWLSIAIQAVTVLGVMWLGAKVFRLGMLMYGKPLTPRALVRALRQGQMTLTSVAGAEGAAPARRRKGGGR